ncbi:MAG: segregation/condensation protein A, partial [Clostridia bacterium]|nr:segregation/condensation protein A [Clostridia bacterium]
METINLKIEQYEGPLDLLLALISKHKIDIFDIPISEICDQYIAYLDAMREMDMEVTSEFVVMASELMLIKSKML